MRLRFQYGWLVVLLAVPVVGQNAPAAATPPAQTAPNAPAADPFPFPKDDSKTNEVPGENPVPAPAANAPAPGSASTPAGAKDDGKFPYPGDDVPAAPSPADGTGYSSSGDNVPGNPAAGSVPDPQVRRKLELRDEGSAGHVDTARADKDLNVADFYIKDGNYAGAYLRYKDAVTFDPDDPDAHFGLAEMARKKGKTAEAIAEYSATLKMDPKGKHAKESRKALAELQPAAVEKK